MRPPEIEITIDKPASDPSSDAGSVKALSFAPSDDEDQDCGTKRIDLHPDNDDRNLALTATTQVAPPTPLSINIPPKSRRESSVRSSPTVGGGDPGDYKFYSNPTSKQPSIIAAGDEKGRKDSTDDHALAAQKNTLYDPEVRRQLGKLKAHKPIFIIVMTVLQFAALGVSFGLNYIRTGSLIQTNPFNYFIGPTPGVLITMGARIVPCIRPGATINSRTLFECYDGSSTSLNITSASGKPVCNLAETCGFSGKADQWYRFIMPIFLHGGVLHFAFNMSFQLRTGIQMEKDWGWWRMALIYFTCGIAGFIFGGNFSPYTPSVGCSGALYGLIACTVIDLFQNWKMMTRPFMDLLNLILTVVVSLGIGLLPFVDNFAHVCGFVTGIFAGLLFMPSLIRTRAARIRKIVFMIVSFIVLVVLYDGLITMFYNGISCDWCKYLNCIPGLPWCADKWGPTQYNFY